MFASLEHSVEVSGIYAYGTSGGTNSSMIVYQALAPCFERMRVIFPRT